MVPESAVLGHDQISKGKTTGNVSSIQTMSMSTAAHILTHVLSTPSTLSSDFLQSLPSSLEATDRPSDESVTIRNELFDLLHKRDYSNLVKQLRVLTDRNRPLRWRRMLKPSEMSYIMKQIIEHQARLVSLMGTSITLDKDSVGTAEMRTNVKVMVKDIRVIYGNMLESPLLYGTRKSSDPRPGEDITREMVKRLLTTAKYQLLPLDYENLVTMELHNGKLDFALQWFQHMATVYPGGEHYRHMTPLLWLLKMELFGSGLPQLWIVKPSKWHHIEINPRRLRFRAEMHWLDVVNDYMANQRLLLHLEVPVLDRDVVATMIASMSYLGHVPQVLKLVENHWGIDERGKLVEDFVKPDVGDPLYPTVQTMTTVVVSMMFNRRYANSMAYLNAFQQHYGVDLTSVRDVWDKLFRWSEITTRYTPDRVLQHFLKETAPSIPAGTLLAEAKARPDFDFEGYLKFSNDIANQRFRLLDEVWRCYHQCSPLFSVRPYITYLTALRDQAHDLPEVFYNYLAALRREKRLREVPAASFNVGIPSRRMHDIHSLYLKGMRALIQNRVANGHEAEIPYVVAKWLLDDAMTAQLTRDVAQQLEGMTGEREHVDADLEDDEGLDSDDRFLGIMS